MNEESSSSISSSSSAALKERLETAASVASFRSTPISNFRRHLVTCLKEILLAASSSHQLQDVEVETETTKSTPNAPPPPPTTTTYWKIQSDSLLEGLKGVPWKEICQCHDQLGGARDDNSTTPLEEVLGQLMDVSVLPRSCVGVVVGALLEALLESPRRAATTITASSSHYFGDAAGAATPTLTTTVTRWTPSQRLLLQSIATLWDTCPALYHTFPGWITTPLLQSQQTQHFTPHKWNRLLSVASHLASDCPRAHSTMLVFLLQIVGRVDQMDMDMNVDEMGQLDTDSKRDEQITAGSSPAAVGPYCLRCSNDLVASVLVTPRRRSRGVRLANLEDLHDKDISTTNYRPRYLSNRASLPVGGLSLKQVLSAKRSSTSTSQHANMYTSTADCPSCQRREAPMTSRKQNTRRRRLPNEWAVVRCRGYKKFLALFQKQRVMIFGQRDQLPGGKFDLPRLLQAAHDNYQSPCLRLLLRLACHSHNSTSRTAIYACRVTWTKFASTMDSMWLRMYTEIVVEWSCFDKADACWDIMRPLVDHILKIIEAQDEHTSEDQPPQNYHSYRDIFQCLAQILSRRSRLFLLGVTKIRDDFQSFVTQLAIHFGEIPYWFDSNDQDILDEANARFCVLQRLGILGLTSLNYLHQSESMEMDGKDENSDMDSCIETNPPCSDETFLDWPFSEPFDLRSAYERVGSDGKTKFEDWDNLLTAQDFDENLGRLLEDQRLGKVGRKSTGPPLTDYIDNPDLLLQIFIYSGYQAIVKCRQVCSAWKTTIDSSNTSLWQEVYRSRFPVHPADPRAGSREPRDAAQQPEDWNGLFIRKMIVERSLLHRRHQGTGYKHRPCSYIGCCHILKSARLEDLHYKYHQRQAMAKASNPKRQKTPGNSKKRAVGKSVKSSSSSEDKKRSKLR